MTTIIILITLIYVSIICAFIFGFIRIKEVYRKDLPAFNSFTIIIPFRNEAHNLPNLLTSLARLEYPTNLFEILLINDESEDNFMQIINDFKTKNKGVNFKVINSKRISNSPKKDAIETGIEFSNFDWILSTDADCVLPKYWIASYDSFIQLNNPIFIAGPVSFKTNNSFLDTFQLLDFSALIGCTIGGFGIEKPFMCNGANLCYQKNGFKAVNGFLGNKYLASGDDIFLLEKMIKKYPKQTRYLKSLDALVNTATMPDLKGLINQRIRWASKSVAYSNPFVKFIGLIVLLMNALCTILIIKAFLYLSISLLSLLVLSLKIGVDFIIILITLKFVEKPSKLIQYPLISLFHPFFNFSIAIIALLNRTYHWKNRKLL